VDPSKDLETGVSSLPHAVPCPVCRGPLVWPVWTCGACETGHHTACSEEIGGCARYACSEAASPERRLGLYLRSRVQFSQDAAQSCAVLMGGSLSVAALGCLLGGPYRLDCTLVAALVLLPLLELLPALWRVRSAAQDLRLLASRPGPAELRSLLLSDSHDESQHSCRCTHNGKTAKLKHLIGFGLLTLGVTLPLMGLVAGPQALLLGLAFLMAARLDGRAAAARTATERMFTSWLEEIELHRLEPAYAEIAAGIPGKKKRGQSMESNASGAIP
jgi:hypothetical protein